MESEEHLITDIYQYLFENSPQPSWIFDQETQVFLEVNKAAVELYGYSKPEFLSLKVKDICPNDHHIASMYGKENEDQTGHNSCDHQHRKKDGERIDVEVVHNSIVFKGRKAWFESINDITGKRTMLEDLVLAKERAEANDKLKSAFISNISHEVRTPLNGIIGFSEMLMSPDVTSENKVIFSDIIRKSSTRLIRTITSYMDISMIVSGNLQVFKKHFALNPILGEIKDEFDEVCKSKGLELKVQRPAIPLDIQLNSDPEILRKIFTHLIENAVKFTNKGTIEFGYRKKNEYLEFYVDDSGIGVEEEKIRSIFGNFIKADSTLAQGNEGSGLGLSIANGMVKLLNGELTVESEILKGSTFYFTIPGNSIVREASSEKIVKLSPRLVTDPLILVAEDDEFNYKFIEIILKKSGFKVIRAENGIQAVSICKLNPHVNLVLMDLKMPVMGGIEATRKIKEFLPDMPVIALTACVSTTDEYEALLNGCDEFISKPVDREKLIELISKTLGT
jgi:PAS domain S-box-containing protein